MASDVPVKELRPLNDWLGELGLDRLRADLINGDLDAWWQDGLTGEWRQIPRASWRQKGAVEEEHPSGPYPPFFGRVWASWSSSSKQEPTPSKSRLAAPGWAQKPVISKLREAYPPDGIAPDGTTVSDMCRAIGLDPESKWKTVDRAAKRLRSSASREGGRSKRS
jgi:hypothetical protein